MLKNYKNYKNLCDYFGIKIKKFYISYLSYIKFNLIFFNTGDTLPGRRLVEFGVYGTTGVLILFFRSSGAYISYSIVQYVITVKYRKRIVLQKLIRGEIVNRINNGYQLDWKFIGLSIALIVGCRGIVYRCFLLNRIRSRNLDTLRNTANFIDYHCKKNSWCVPKNYNPQTEVLLNNTKEHRDRVLKYLAKYNQSSIGDNLYNIRLDRINLVEKCFRLFYGIFF